MGRSEQHSSSIPRPVSKERDEKSSFVVRDIVNPAISPSSSQAKERIRWYFVDESRYGIVWPNVLLFVFLHVVYIAGLVHLLRHKLWHSWIFGYWYSLLGAMGVTCGAHRLWSHRSYRASLPLKVWLMVCQSIAGQNDVYTWCRDHRLHHKFSETDADPHNSRRGFFFCHVGWLLTRKHPDVWIKGRTVDCTDLLMDPVLAFQRRYYSLFYLFFCFLLPTLCCHYLIGDTWFDSWIVGSFGRYIVTLHSTWFVNSAAHMFGERPYKRSVEPRDNPWVSWATWGEGFHNYHHVFPYDYAISETGLKLDPMTTFIDLMSFFGLAYDLKRVPRDVVRRVRFRTALESMDENNFQLK